MNSNPETRTPESRTNSEKIRELEDRLKRLREELDEIRKRKAELLKEPPTPKTYKALELLKKKNLRKAILPVAIVAGMGSTYKSSDSFTDMEHINALMHWKERHWDRVGMDDPVVTGLEAQEPTEKKPTSYDFIGSKSIDQGSWEYKSSVFDLTDATPPRFKIIDRKHRDPIPGALGITTNFFREFQTIPELRARLAAKKETDPAVIGYNTQTQYIRAGKLSEFSGEDWLFSLTHQVPIEFELNEAGLVKTQYVSGINRMAPIVSLPDGQSTVVPIGIIKDQKQTAVDPDDANRFGILEGGKIILACGPKQVQVNGSFKDIFNTYKKLKQDYPDTPVTGFALDNGSYSLPIWVKDTAAGVTKQILDIHFGRNPAGGTALVLLDDGAVKMDTLTSTMDKALSEGVEVVEKKDYAGVLKNPYLVSTLYYSAGAISKMTPPNQTEPEKIISTLNQMVTKEFKDGYVNFLRQSLGTNALSNKESAPLDMISVGKKLEENHGDAIDLFIKEGSPVYSMASGIVVLAENGWDKNNPLSTSSQRGGNTVIIFNPQNNSFARYAHMSEVKVKPGQVVNSGDSIGIVGHTGMNASKKGQGGHLHLEVNRYEPKTGETIPTNVFMLKKQLDLLHH